MQSTQQHHQNIIFFNLSSNGFKLLSHRFYFIDVFQHVVYGTHFIHNSCHLKNNLFTRPLISYTFNKQSHVSFDVFAPITFWSKKSCIPMTMMVLAFMSLYSHFAKLPNSLTFVLDTAFQSFFCLWITFDSWIFGNVSFFLQIWWLQMWILVGP